MKFNVDIPCFSLLLFLAGSVFFPCGAVFSQEPLSGEMQRKIVPEDTQKSIKDLLQKCFAHRDQIKTGQMNIAYTLTKKNRNGKLEVPFNQEIFLAFDEERHRVDRSDRNGNSLHGSNEANYVAVGCYYQHFKQQKN